MTPSQQSSTGASLFFLMSSRYHEHVAMRMLSVECMCALRYLCTTDDASDVLKTVAMDGSDSCSAPTMLHPTHRPFLFMLCTTFGTKERIRTACEL